MGRGVDLKKAAKGKAETWGVCVKGWRVQRSAPGVCERGARAELLGSAGGRAAAHGALLSVCVCRRRRGRSERRAPGRAASARPLRAQAQADPHGLLALAAAAPGACSRRTTTWWAPSGSSWPAASASPRRR